MSNALGVYLAYPTLSWFSDKVHDNLQAALRVSLAARRDSLLAAMNSRLEQAMIQDTVFREDLLESYQLLVRIGESGLPQHKQGLFADMLVHARARPDFFEARTTLTIGRESYLGLLRRTVWNALATGAHTVSNGEASIVGALGLFGPHRVLLEGAGVLVCDNNGLDLAQWSALDRMLRAIPRALHNLQFISVNEFLGIYTLAPHYLRLGYSGSAVNIFGSRVGAGLGNQFPVDGPTGVIDLFNAALAHEINHVVDAYGVEGDVEYRNRRVALLAAAGDDSLNYLQSKVPRGHYVAAPQEFFAAISNLWFASSINTLRLGRIRLAAGRPEPLHQALFFADVYSQGRDTTYFMEFEGNNEIRSTPVGVARDARKRITGLTFGDSLFSFGWGGQGSVTSATAGLWRPLLSVGRAMSLDSFTVGSRPRRDSVALRLTGPGAAAATWAAVHGSASWLKLDAATGSGPAFLRWTIDPGGLPPGNYSDTTTISVTTTSGAGGSPAKLVHWLSVYEPPIVARCAVSELIGASCLGPRERGFLDETGNRDGAYNLGDLLSWLDRKQLALHMGREGRGLPSEVARDGRPLIAEPAEPERALRRRER